jgi:uracil-DNA glycosylase
MIEFDPGPPPAFAEIFARLPDYTPFKESFWYDWGPVFYRGRQDGSARLLCVSSDPGPTERVALRTLVGDAGQRVQGFLTKIGLTRSYLCLNAFAYALYPSRFFSTDQVLNDPQQRQWRNDLFNQAKTPNLQAIVAFGNQAQTAVHLWDGRGSLPVFNIPHPSSRDATKLLDAWRAAVTQLRTIVTPDADGNAAGPNYGAKFVEADYSRVPLRDLPFGVPPWLGDDAWGRKGKPKHNNCVSRPTPDDRHTLTWIAPRS